MSDCSQVVFRKLMVDITFVISFRKKECTKHDAHFFMEGTWFASLNKVILKKRQ